MSKIVLCPECAHDLVIYDIPVSGQIIRCSNCDIDLEIIDAETMELDWAYKSPVVRDDWQDLIGFLGPSWIGNADWEDTDEGDDLTERDDDIEDEDREQVPVR